MKKIIYGTFALLIIIIDQIVKNIMINVKINLIKDTITLSYVENTKAALSIGNYHIVTMLSIVIIVLFCIITFINRKKITNFIPITLVLSGGISNLIDRIFRGFVVDYISIFNFPVFNIADICIVIGVIIIVVQMINNSLRKDKLD